MRKLHFSFVHSILSGLVILAFSSTADAQFKASLQGTVSDTSGAVVSGATVTVTNQETGKSQQVKTSDEGFYRVSGLAPGRYTVSAEISGFKKQVLENIVVNAEETQGVNIALEAGQVAESVTVTADQSATQLQTETANISKTITTSGDSPSAASGTRPLRIDSPHARCFRRQRAFREWWRG